jgi:hypothetical protein
MNVMGHVLEMTFIDRASFSGSEQEFDKKPISRGFPENHEFGLGDSHTLSFEEQIT